MHRKGRFRLEIVRQVASGYASLLHVPWVYLGMVVFVWLQYRRTQSTERAAFGLRVTSPIHDGLISVGLGLMVSVVVSAVLYDFRLPITWHDALWLWAAVLVLTFWNIRFSCLSYASSLISWVSVAAILTLRFGHWHSTWLLSLSQIHASAFLFIAGLLHIAEGGLAMAVGHRNASPLYVQSRRGQIVGAFVLQKLWPMPLLIHTGVGLFLPLPVLAGFGGVAIGDIPQAISRRMGPIWILYGILLGGGAYLSFDHPYIAGIVGVMAVLAHELLYWVSKRWQAELPPLFVRPNRGVRVLATVPGSPAHKLGLQPGETIVRVAGIQVNSTYDIHFAMDQNPAYVKVEVLDTRGEVRFVGTPVFAGDPHQLGIIVVPDEKAWEYADVFGPSFSAFIGRCWARKRSYLVRDPEAVSRSVQ